MAKQIIVTQNDYGIELETQFVDDKKKPLDITGYEVRVKIIYDDKTIVWHINHCAGFGISCHYSTSFGSHMVDSQPHF